MPNPALFITYDGLTDPLGGSQILPYLRSIAAHPRPVHILSFEKPDRYAAGGAPLAQALADEGIGWTPLPFSRGGAPAKAWDLVRMHAAAFRIARRTRAKVIHCRGHLAAQVGYLLKRALGVRLLFDFRGMWVDERVDKGGWTLAKPLDRAAFRSFKRIEGHLLRHSDQIVVLTAAMKTLLGQWGVAQDRVTVIPCCADFQHFTLPTEERRAATRDQLGLPGEGVVVGYLGSIGAMYMTPQFLELAERAFDSGTAVAVLCITPDVAAMTELIDRRGWSHKGIPYRVIAGTRDEVPHLLSGMDVMASFFLPTPARVGTSPTKMAECFALGIPMVTNPGVGDMEALVAQVDGGLIVDPSKEQALLQAAGSLVRLAANGGARLREAARPVLGLARAEAGYRAVYDRLEDVQC